MSEKTVTITPITRLEGHGKIEIFPIEEGNVENAYDPCLSCVIHFAVGQMPLEIKTYNHQRSC
jgi:F420-non-reducing hydrogenase large subunit